MSDRWSCSRAKTLLVPSGPNLKRHLFALILDPVVVDGRGTQPHVLMACVVSVKEHVVVDDACLLWVGDHPFILHDSFVDYRHTRLEPVLHVEDCVARGTFIPKEDCSRELMQRIVGGALRSTRISREHKKLLEKVLFE